MNGVKLTIEPIVIGKSRTVRFTATIDGKTYRAYCPRGHYDYNEIHCEVLMWEQLWGQMAESVEGFVDEFYDASKLSEAWGSMVDRTALLRKVA